MIEDIRVVRFWEWRESNGHRWQHECGYELQAKVGGEWRKVREEWQKGRPRDESGPPREGV